MPLYRAGLWLAVNIAPGTSRCPLAKYIMSVLASPASATETPWAVTPSVKASTSGREDVRMSCATTTSRASTSRAKAAPTARATCSSSWSG